MTLTMIFGLSDTKDIRWMMDDAFTIILVQFINFLYNNI